MWNGGLFSPPLSPPPPPPPLPPSLLPPSLPPPLPPLTTTSTSTTAEDESTIQLQTPSMGSAKCFAHASLPLLAPVPPSALPLLPPPPSFSLFLSERWVPNPSIGVGTRDGARRCTMVGALCWLDTLARLHQSGGKACDPRAQTIAAHTFGEGTRTDHNKGIRTPFRADIDQWSGSRARLRMPALMVNLI